MASLWQVFFAAAEYANCINNHSNLSCRIAAEYHVMNRLGGLAAKLHVSVKLPAVGMPTGCLLTW